MSDFKSLNLHASILEALEKKGYVNPTPIQAESIPHLLEKKDLLGIAQTGTGKTAAFSLPLLHNLALNRIKTNSKSMRALILTPTRELASQIADNIKLYGKNFGFKHVVIFGGVGENPQIAAMQKGVDIVIATPGRLLDLTEQGYIKYDQLEVFVLDEADRMLDMGFINDIRRIIRYLPEKDKRQTLLFSATMPRDISDLAHSILNNPVRVEVTPASTTVEKIEQSVCFVEKSHKAALLKHFLEQPEVRAALVFCRMKHGANKVEEYLEKHGIKAAAIHGNKTQGARERALKQFRDGQVKVLVATDIAARGIDIPLVSHVFNYDIPQEPEAYVHRIGRTARAGREGVAISFCDSLERGMLKAVEKTIKKSIPVDNAHPFEGVAEVTVTRKISSAKPGERNHNRSSQPFKGGRIFAAKQGGNVAESAREPGRAHPQQRSRPHDRSPQSRDRAPHSEKTQEGQERRPQHKKRPQGNNWRQGEPRDRNERDSRGGSAGSHYRSERKNDRSRSADNRNDRREDSRGGKRKGGHPHGQKSIKSKIGGFMNWLSRKK